MWISIVKREIAKWSSKKKSQLLTLFFLKCNTDIPFTQNISQVRGSSKRVFEEKKDYLSTEDTAWRIVKGRAKGTLP